MTTEAHLPLGDDARLPADIFGLDRLCRPVWVFDPVAERKLYANPSAIDLWGAFDLASLRQRDFSVKSPAARTRTEQLLLAVKAGKNVTEVWNFYPNGKSVSVKAVASHLVLRDGSSALLFEASLLDEPDLDYMRALEAVRQAATPVSLYDAAGTELFGNPSAYRTYGDREQFECRCEDLEAARSAWCLAKEGRFQGRLLMRTEKGVVWHDVILQWTLDPITGNTAILSYERDDTDKMEVETRLATQMAALEIATAKAEAANQAKSTFLANMSHEIRTPLNGVVSLADLLCRSPLNAAQLEAAELIRASGRTLDLLLADILQVAQIEAGEVKIVIAPFDVASVAKDVTDLLRFQASENGSTLALRVKLPETDRRSGDSLRFRQILTNLVSNAVKFTTAGVVLVVLEKQGDGIRVMVQDSGIGFDQDQEERLFERFQQADHSMTRRVGGSGLGLAITSDLVQRLGGHLGCESAVGVGSSFWVDLPFACVNDSIPGSAPAQPKDDLHGVQVLVADDHPVNRRVMELILEPLGAAVVSVDNGAQAVTAVQEVPFDVVLMDMQMPVMDGLEATKTIVELGGPPVIMVSANGQPDHVAAAVEAGAIAYVTKPVEPAALVEVVVAAVQPGPNVVQTHSVSLQKSKPPLH